MTARWITTNRCSKICARLPSLAYFKKGMRIKDKEREQCLMKRAGQLGKMGVHVFKKQCFA